MDGKTFHLDGGIKETPIEKGKKYVDALLKRIGDMPVSELNNSFKGIPESPDELYKMLEYLPEEFIDETEEKYIEALMLATQTSYENGLYQFAYVQYHMLFMTAVYYALLKVSILHEDDLHKAIYYLLKDRSSDFWNESNKKAGKLYFGSFAIISESDVFMLLRIVGLDNNLLGDLRKPVRERNRYVHANGQLQLTSDELFMEEIRGYNGLIQRVIELLKEELIGFYKKILSDPNFYDPDIRAYSDPDEQIVQVFIKEYSVSRAEMNWLRKIKLSDFDSCEGKAEIKALHGALIHYYQELTQDDNQLFDDPYVLSKYKNNAGGFAENELGISAYECGKEGGEFPVYFCPECGEEQLVYDADTQRFHCFACDQNYTEEDLTFCERCGSLMRRNGKRTICQSCIQNMAGD